MRNQRKNTANRKDLAKCIEQYLLRGSMSETSANAITPLVILCRVTKRPLMSEKAQERSTKFPD